jgi:BirA family transcriptional regulator, biotin operon repressor / biotin---[acetyl-CoA-carboxylase] ligase
LSSDPGTGAAGWPEGYDRRVLPEIDSTNAEAERIAPGLTQPTWVLALHQTAARGRRGRPWLMPKGNFAASLVMRPSGEVADFALRSFVAALALADALGEVAGAGAEITLKWPNDVLLNGGKVAGILLESAGSGADITHLVVGIGVNLAAAPDAGALEAGAVAPVSVLGETGVQVAPEVFLTRLARRFADWERQLATYGFPPVRQAWLGRAARLGQPVTARTMTQVITGVFTTIGGDGALILRDQTGGVHSIPAADVYF